MEKKYTLLDLKALVDEYKLTLDDKKKDEVYDTDRGRDTTHEFLEWLKNKENPKSKETKRWIRKSGYNDYFAIDLVDREGNTKETPLYLKRGEQKEIKMRWDEEGSFNVDKSYMVKAFIKFDGQKVEVAYAESLGGGIHWWEPTNYELENKSFIHFKV